MKYPKIKNRFEQILTEKHMTARELAIKSGVNETSISQYVNGRHAPSNVSSTKMAEVLGVDPLWLMGFDQPKTPRSLADSKEEAGILFKFSKLSPQNQKHIEALIDSMLEGE